MKDISMCNSEVFVLSAFPGTGKTTLVKNLADTDVTVHDSDSSQWPKDNFPKNYVDHIEDLVKQGLEKDGTTLILVSSHEAVRAELTRRKISYMVVVPEEDLKEDYLKRYRDRGSPEAFVNLIDANWDAWLTDIHKHTSLNSIIHLAKDQGLTDIMMHYLKNRK